jgi:Lon protease-like protein
MPMFPLNTVLFPGVATPLHVFEDRYRALVHHLLREDDPAERVFGVTAIREGYEVGERGVQSLHTTGTVMQLTEVEAYEDGRFDIEVVGRQRMRLHDLESSGAYPVGVVDLLEERDAEDAEVEAERTLATFETYRARLGELRGAPVLSGDLPRDPTYLSWALATTCLLTLPERQSLLEAPDAAIRLALLRRSLVRELRAMKAVPSLPATEVARTRWSPN